tara:strand:+ start:92 stop:295 length:204 start_codon:yes stop_codon:yes gene_type:complete
MDIIGIPRGGLTLVEISFTAGTRGGAGRFLGGAALTGSKDLSARLNDIKVKLIARMQNRIFFIIKDP